MKNDSHQSPQLRSEKAATLVEFAIVAPLVMFFLFGLVDIGFIMRDYLSISLAVKQSATIASKQSGSLIPCTIADHPFEATVRSSTLTLLQRYGVILQSPLDSVTADIILPTQLPATIQTILYHRATYISVAVIKEVDCFFICSYFPQNLTMGSSSLIRMENPRVCHTDPYPWDDTYNGLGL